MLKHRKQIVQLWTIHHLSRLTYTYWIRLSTAGTFVLFYLSSLSFLYFSFLSEILYVLSCFRHWYYQYAYANISSLFFCRYFPMQYMLYIVDDGLWNIFITIYIYIYVCVCVCVYTYIYTYIYIYIYIYI